jgi:hypothetical protein
VDIVGCRVATFIYKDIETQKGEKNTCDYYPNRREFKMNRLKMDVG